MHPESLERYACSYTSHDHLAKVRMPVPETKVLSAERVPLRTKEHSAEPEAVIGSNMHTGGQSE